MKKIRKKLIIVLFIIVATTIGIYLGLYLSNNNRQSNRLTLEENQWIDSNKHDVIDVAVINDIPIISYDGKGLIYDYLDYVSKSTSLEFNIITYKYETEANYTYKLDIVKELKYDDISIYKDNLVYISIDNHEYNNVKELSNLKIGVLNSEKEELTSYFANTKVELIGYENYDKLNSAMKEAKENLTAGNKTSINGIIILKSLFTKEMIENNYRVAYNFDDLIRYFALSIDDNKELRGILSKKYKSWNLTNYEESYNKNLLDNYYNFKNISDTEQKKLSSKNYSYGFISNGIIDDTDDKHFKGFNSLLLKSFSDFSNVSISYKEYNNIKDLIENFNLSKVDFILNMVDNESYNLETYITAGVYEKNFVAVSGINNKSSLKNIGSLKNKEVLIIKNTSLEIQLKNNGIKVKSYNNLENLVNDFGVDDIAIVELENFNFYKTSKFKDSRIYYIFENNSKYNYVINNKDDNKVFASLFDFYITYTNIDEIIASNYSAIAYENSNLFYIMVFVILILSIYIVVDFSYHIKTLFKVIIKRRKIKMTKEDKIKYIDQLTSLKNRNYLNTKIEEWDNSEVYPQSIIVIDLNNVAYINDNYGREEGDKVIKEAANILMQHQMENSEIMRTDGNEFLIFLVGYTEKQVISYLRKLNKEFKNLSHGFGAASGYSIINDAIKTFDDAVNEAVLDMKNNKEDIDY